METEMAEIIMQPFLQVFRELIILARKIEKAIQLFTQVVIQTRDNDSFQILFDFLCRVLAHGTH